MSDDRELYRSIGRAIATGTGEDFVVYDEYINDRMGNLPTLPAGWVWVHDNNQCLYRLTRQDGWFMEMKSRIPDLKRLPFPDTGDK